MKIVEAIPNFSVGRDKKIIDAIAVAISSTEGVKLLNVDPGYDANRTVYTFAGEVEAVCSAAFSAAKVASELIDMSTHQGKHPRIGAVDVLPIVPISGIDMEECVSYSLRLAERISSELSIPIYLYEHSAMCSSRKNLASCRAGEYEGLSKKIVDPKWAPDFGAAEYTDTVKKSGLTVLGAREFLVAVNFNLSTKDSSIASKIAGEVREKGAPLISEDGSFVFDDNGKKVFKEGLLKGLKAIGWYIEEYGFAQVSTNICSIDTAPLHLVWQTVSKVAQKYGVEVTGTELIGLVPKRVFQEAATALAPANLSESEAIDYVVKTMNLSQIAQFDTQNRIIENLLFR